MTTPIIQLTLIALFWYEALADRPDPRLNDISVVAAYSVAILYPLIVSLMLIGISLVSREFKEFKEKGGVPYISRSGEREKMQKIQEKMNTMSMNGTRYYKFKCLLFNILNILLIAGIAANGHIVLAVILVFTFIFKLLVESMYFDLIKLAKDIRFE